MDNVYKVWADVFEKAMSTPTDYTATTDRFISNLKRHGCNISPLTEFGFAAMKGDATHFYTNEPKLVITQVGDQMPELVELG